MKPLLKRDSINGENTLVEVSTHLQTILVQPVGTVG